MHKKRARDLNKQVERIQGPPPQKSKNWKTSELTPRSSLEP